MGGGDVGKASPRGTRRRNHGRWVAVRNTYPFPAGTERTWAAADHRRLGIMVQTADVVLIGGGIIGASIAYYLRQDGFAGRILVIERDTTYTRAATPMSLGGVLQLYGVSCNIQLARYSLQFYERFDEVMSGGWGQAQAHFHQRGY